MSLDLTDELLGEFHKLGTEAGETGTVQVAGDDLVKLVEEVRQHRGQWCGFDIHSIHQIAFEQHDIVLTDSEARQILRILGFKGDTSAHLETEIAFWIKDTGFGRPPTDEERKELE